MEPINCWIPVGGSIGEVGHISEYAHLYYRSPSQGVYGGRPLGGTSLTLALSAVAGHCPVGILLDRLEEHPEEVEGADPAEVRACVAYLRTKYPNGV